jgi:2-isopropylmalate synthase
MAGTNGLIVCDTVGGATPTKVRGLINFTKTVLKANGLLTSVTIDWHGHNDLGQGLECAFVAAQCGVTNVHGTVLGIGERAGNVPMELLLVNSNYRGHSDRNLDSLANYVRLGASMTNLPIPVNYPCFGADVLTTQTGVHAAAQLKAREKGESWLEDAVYSAVPAKTIGRHHESAVGPMSGKANVIWFCHIHGFPLPSPAQMDKVLNHARETGRILPPQEVIQILFH